MVKPAEKTRARVEKLTALLEGKKHLLIVMQDNPDPDAIASAVALRELAHKLSKVICSIAHSGTVGRAENRALVRYLGLNLRFFEDIDLKQFDLIGLVDTQPRTGNNPLPEGAAADIVIDHHPYRRATSKAKLIDIRSGYGATATILYEYLREAKITPDITLATAIIYAIRSDTQDLGLEASKADIEAIRELYPLANKRMLSQIQRGQVQREYFQILAAGLHNARIYGNCLITGLGDIVIPDMIGEMADLMLRDDEVKWVMCYGYYDQKLLISLRTSETGKRADKIVHQIVARRGTGGGHDTIAGGRIDLKKGTKTEKEKLEKAIREKFLNILGVEGNGGEHLIKKNGK